MKKISLLLAIALSAIMITANNSHAYNGVTYDSNGKILDVDLNGDVFVDADYSAVTWEVNLEDMATDSYYRRAVVALPLQFVPKLEIKTNTYYFYKSMFVKYDARLISELITLLLAYETAMDELMIEQQSNSEAYYDKALGYTLEFLLTKKFSKLVPIIQIIIDDVPVQKGIDVMLDELKDALIEDIIEDANFDDPYTKFLAELLVGMGVDSVEDLSVRSIGEITSESGRHLGNLIIDTLISQLLSLPETLITLHPLGKFAFASIYWLMGQSAEYAAIQYGLILESISDFVSELLNPHNMGKNLRFDYLLEHDINANSISWSENYAQMESNISYKHRGMAITFADTDVIYKNICNTYRVTDLTLSPEKNVQLKGRINLLNETQMYNEINNLFNRQYQAHDDNPNKFVFSSTYTRRYYQNTYTSIQSYASFNLVSTPLRMKNVDLSLAPTQILYPTNYGTGYKIDITQASNLEKYTHGLLRVYNNTTLLYEFDLTGLNEQVIVSGLVHGKVYRFEIYIKYKLNFFIYNNIRVSQREVTYIYNGGGGGGGTKPPISELMF